MKNSITFRTFALFVILFPALSVLEAQDMLVKYTFNGGSLAPDYVANGVVAGSLGQHGTTVTYSTATKESRECLIVNNTQTSIGAANCLYLPLGPESGKKLRIVRTVITHRKATANTTTNNIRSYLYSVLGTGNTNNLIYSGTGGFSILNNVNWLIDQIFEASTGGGIVAPIDIDATHYASLSVNKTTTGTSPAEWWIDEIAFYGYVFMEGDVISPDKVDFGDTNTMHVASNSNFDLQGFNIADDMTLTLEGADAGLFSLSHYAFTASEVNAGVTVTVNYTPISNNAPDARIRISYGSTVKNIPLLGTVPLIFETFDTKDMTGLVNTSPLTNLSDYTVLPGWTSENVTEWHKSSSYNFAPALLSKVDTVASYTTPEIDLSKPFKVSMLGKRIQNDNNGESYVMVNQDTIYYVDNPNNSLRLNTIDGYIATANSRVTFSGKGVENNRIAFDNINISYTTSPTVSLPLSATKSFGVVAPGSHTTIDIPVKGYYLTSDLTVSTPSNGVFELLSGTTITKAAVEDEDGAIIQLKFSPPTNQVYSAYIQLTGGGLLQNGIPATRTIYLTGEGGISTNVDVQRLQPQMGVNNQTLWVVTSGKATVEVYGITGSLLMQKDFTNSIQVNIGQGVYVVRVREQEDVFVRKIIVR